MRADIVQWAGRGAGLAAGAGGVAIVAFIASRSASVLLLVFLGVLLAAALEPVVDVLGRRLPLSRIQAIVAVYVAFFALVVAFVAFVVPAAIGEAERILEPLIGPLLGAIPALLVALTISPETAIAVAVVYVLIQFVEGNVLVPVVMRNAVGLSPLLVLLSLLVGAAVGGLVGALVAVPVVAAIEVLLEPLQARAVPVATDPRVEGEPDVSAESDAPEVPGEVAAQVQT